MLIRPATVEDAGAMSALLNEVITKGGTTAIEGAVSARDVCNWMARNPDRSAWHVAASDDGILGFQWIEPNAKLPPEAADIASFVRVGSTGGGIGARLFATTCAAATGLGYRWINASIRSDNTVGLGYYRKMGFQVWDEDPTASLSDGTVTGKTHTRFELG
ncbi:MAG: GNAT family N-acetyltransferase [Pseudomonadota bacterium]